MSTIQTLSQKSSHLQSFEAKNKHTWCSGCGNFGILNGLKRALTLEGILPHQAVLCFDVGCNGNGSDKIHANTIHGLHGRVIPLACGIAIANSNLEVIAMAGDGATFSEGINHLVHAIRNNYNITFICHNNSNYGLTIGQASSTTRKGSIMAGTPDGVVAEPLNTLDFVLSLKPTFVARSFSGDVEHITNMIRAGMNHEGFSYVEILQACPTFNKDTPQEWYWDKIKYLDETYDSTDIWQARKIVQDIDTEIALGIIYEDKTQSDFLSRLPTRQGISSTLVEEVQSYEVQSLLQKFV